MNVVKVRETLGFTQAQFWERVGITQSGGSRYEKGDREIPEPISILLILAYGTPAQWMRAMKTLRPDGK